MYIKSISKEIKMSVNVQKCAIIGCGFVGATTAYTLIQSELFSEIVLIDIDRKRQRERQWTLFTDCHSFLP